MNASSSILLRVMIKLDQKKRNKIESTGITVSNRRGGPIVVMS